MGEAGLWLGSGVATCPRGRLLGLDVTPPPRPPALPHSRRAAGPVRGQVSLLSGLEDHEPCWPSWGAGGWGRRGLSLGAAPPSPDFPAPHPVDYVGLLWATPTREQGVWAGDSDGLSQAFLSSELGGKELCVGFLSSGKELSSSCLGHMRAVGLGP